MLTPEQLAERIAQLKVLAEKATPGPYESRNGDEYDVAEVIVAPKTLADRFAPIIVALMGQSDEQGDADAAYFAACDRDTILALIEENERKLNVLNRYEDWEAKFKAWRGGLPMFTKDLYDEWIEIQALRNAAIRETEQTK